MNADDPVFHALADPNRRRLLDLLHARNGRTLVELYRGLSVSRQAAAKHLAVLEGANLVASLGLGREKLHFINPARSTRSPNAGSANSIALA